MERAYDLISELEKSTGLEKAALEVFIKETFSAIEKALKKDQVVTIEGFGQFKTIDNEPLTTVNPYTKEVIQLSDGKKPVFLADSELLEKVKF